MGSMIHLYVGNLQVDWGKNRGFTDHSAFFQASDVAAVPYYYVADGSDYVDAKGETKWKLNVVYKEGLSKPLVEVKDRIELLGHTIAHCREEFMYLAGLNDFDSDVFEFDDLREALATVDVSSVALTASQGDEDFGEFFQGAGISQAGNEAAGRRQQACSVQRCRGDGEPVVSLGFAFTGRESCSCTAARYLGLCRRRERRMGSARRICPTT
jgi:hypothetical protein